VKGECEKVVSASLYNSTWNSYAFTPQQVLRKSAMERFRTGRRSFYWRDMLERVKCSQWVSGYV